METESKPGPPDSIARAGSQRMSFLAALAVAVASGLIAFAFNQLIVQKRQPIFDSVSYLERMHRVMSFTVRNGHGAGLKEAVVGNTVCLPYLAVLPFSEFVRPGRWIGIVFQSVGVAMFLLLLDRWMVWAGVLRCHSRVIALTSFAALEMVWFTNGGLSDFRMDFSLMLGYGMTAMAAGLALRSEAKLAWLMCGVVAAGTCLVRGTAPVYLAAALVPVWLVHFAFGRRQLAGVCLATGSCAVLCGWFYWINFEYLKYYYLVWNTDANASLDWSTTWRHFLMVSRQAGVPFMAGTLVLGGLAWKWRTKTPASEADARNARGMNAEMLWCAAVPMVLLIGKGAGINPFVSMPTMIALFIALATLLGRLLERLDRPQTMIVVTVVCLMIGGALGRGIKKHGWPKDQFMQANQQIISDLVADAKKSGLANARFGGLQTCDIHTDSLWGVVLYDRPDVRVDGQIVWIGETRLEPIRMFMLPAQANWDEVDGTNDEQKRRSLVSRVELEFEYLIMPDETTASAIQQSGVSDVINQHIPAIRALVVSEVEVELLGEYSSPNSPNRYQLFRVGERKWGKQGD